VAGQPENKKAGQSARGTFSYVAGSTVSLALILSLAAHVMGLGAVASLSSFDRPKPPPIKVKVVIQEPPANEEVVVSEPPPPPPPPPPPKKKREALASERKAQKEAPLKQVAPVQGLSPEAVVAPGLGGISVPLGNTLLAPDEGKRLRADEVEALSGEDLSQSAKVIRSSVAVPEYTDEAVAAWLEGNAVVDVYVDEEGRVSEAELKRKVGYGMDERLVDAARRARFKPRKDRFGRAVPGWSEVKFRLEMP